MINRRELLSRFAPVVLWMGVIFLLSSSIGSSPSTSIIIRPLLEFLFPNAPDETLRLYHGYVRKAAHFIEYAVLGILACRMFIKTGFSRAAFRWVIASVLLVAAVAAVDEINQSFNALRTSSPFDVMIDLLGGVFGVSLIWLSAKYRDRSALNGPSA